RTDAAPWEGRDPSTQGPGPYGRGKRQRDGSCDQRPVSPPRTSEEDRHGHRNGPGEDVIGGHGGEPHGPLEEGQVLDRKTGEEERHGHGDGDSGHPGLSVEARQERPRGGEPNH